VITFPRLAAGVTVEDLDPDLCLFRPDIDEVLVLNQTAGDVVRLADGARSIVDMVELLARVYGQPSTDLAADVTAVVQDLSSRGYVQDAADAVGSSS
jgi:hypothetical protein